MAIDAEKSVLKCINQSINLFNVGPFWICTTLVFTTAIAGNMANYIQYGGKDYQWRYDFHKGIMDQKL